MSWIISQALMQAYANSHCFQEQEEGYLEDTCSDGVQSAPSNGTPMQPVYLSPDKMTAFSRLSRFGMMCKPLTADRGEDLLTWYLEDSRAKTLAVQEKEQESLENAAGCGRTWRASLAKYDPDTHSLKTAQCSLFEDLKPSSVTLPRWGSMLNGELFPQQIVERPISESEFGLWHTPTCHMAKEGAYPAEFNRNTPTLSAEVAFGSPAKKWPTPNASDNRDRGNLSTPAIQRRMEIGKQVTLSMCVSTESGKLNPNWVERLMGWPDGWTDLQPLWEIVNDLTTWGDDWESGVARTSVECPARADRLTAIGNGQVPICAATAWNILSK